MSQVDLTKYLEELKEEFGELPPKDLAAAHVGRSFLDLLLLGFIRANPPTGDNPDTEMQRLANAKRALFGKTTKVRQESTDASGFLHQMADLRVLDLEAKSADSNHKIKSDRELARIVVGRDKTNPLTGPEEDKLRRKFADLEASLTEGLSEHGLELIVFQKTALVEIEHVLGIFGIEFHGEF